MREQIRKERPKDFVCGSLLSHVMDYEVILYHQGNVVDEV